MTADVLFEILGEADDAFIASAGRKMAVSRKKRYGIAVGIAACLVLGTMGVRYLPALHTQAPYSDCIPLSDASEGVTAKYVETVPEQFACNDYGWESRTEKELFHSFDTVIFKGTVEKIEKIEVDFDGEKDYCAVIEISVVEVYRGNLQIGEQISALIQDNFWYIACAQDLTLAQVEIGMTGIFMPYAFDDSDIWQRNDAILAEKDLADYGFPDSERFAFLDTKDGLVYAGFAYTSLKNAQTLSDVEDFVQFMLAEES